MQMLTGIDQSDYSKLETGKRYYTFEQLKKLALALDTAAVAFIGIDLDNFANHRGCSFLRAVQCRALLCGALLFSFCCACIIMPSGQ